ncbi:MAG: FtsX-like permease family protein [Firmicutes bacterium]|nr:FtsX-like permease family protein [Bacillota bacterium]
MKSYLSLIPISAKIHRKESRMTIFCIILAVFLVTGIFSMANMEIRSQKIRIIQQYGEWHLRLTSLNENNMSLIASRPDVSATARYSALNYRLDDENYSIMGVRRADNSPGENDVIGKQAVICGADESFLNDIMYYSVKSGNFPKAENEIMLTNNANSVFNINIGDTVEISSPSGEISSFTISGFGDNMVKTESADAVGVFMNLDSFRQFYETAAGQELTDSDISFYVKLDENSNIRQSIREISSAYGLDEDNVAQNKMLLGTIGASDSSYMNGLYIIAGILFVLVLTCGVLMIAGSMNSNIAQKTEFFGMLRCIGASGRQIKRFVRLEALHWCKFAIPSGVILGIIITWVLCAVLRILSGSYFESMPVFGISPIGIAAGIIVGLLTVFLAARSPAKKAAKVSPLAAVSGNAEAVHKIRKTANTGFLKVETALGIHHAKQSKKNFILMIGSFAASIILFFGFSAMVEFLYYGCTPLHPYSPDLSITSPGHFRTVDMEISKRLEDLDCVKRAYGRMFDFNVPAEFDNVLEEFADANHTVTFISYEEHQFDWTRSENIISGNKGAVDQVISESGYVIAVYNPYIPLQAGDKIKTELGEVTVAAVFSSLPFSSGITTEPLICSESTFKSLVGDSGYTIVDIQLSSEATDEDVNLIRAMAGSDTAFSDKRMLNRETRGIYYSFALFVYGFLAVIALITVFNIMNSISMSVSARIKQYGAMRAIGMSIKQLTKMITAEAITYAVFGSITGCLLGLPLNKLVFEKLITAYWGDPWSIPLSLTAIVIPFAVLASAAAVYGPVKRIKKMSVTETIHT